MNKRKFMLISVMLIFAFGFILMGCAEDTQEADGNGNLNDENEESQDNNNNSAAGEDQSEELQITASFSVIADIVENVIGDRGSVEYIVPLHEEPHEFEPVPSDFEKVTDSDVFFTNGLGLEEWLESLLENVTDTPVVELSEGITPIALEGEEDVYDPHVWLDAGKMDVYVDNIVEYLIEVDSEGEDIYQENADAYKEELADLDQWIHEQTETIPEDNRFITVSENAFVYFGEAYGFETKGIWEINAHEEGTPQQISRLVDSIREEEVPALFLETTISPDYMNTVSENSGVDIAGDVYTDSIGDEGSGAETYIKMMEYNVNTFVDALAAE